MMNRAKGRNKTSIDYIKSVAKTATVVDQREINVSVVGNSIFSPLANKILALPHGKALVADFGNNEFMSRNVSLRDICKKNGKKLHTKRINGTWYAMWTTKR
jgi:hypothetical protein